MVTVKEKKLRDAKIDRERRRGRERGRDRVGGGLEGERWISRFRDKC